MADGKRPRGRPRISDTPERIEQARLIGIAVYKLVWWAIATEDVACEAVGKAAKTVLSVTDNEGWAYGPDNIKKSFYEPWIKKENQSRKEKGWDSLPRAIEYTRVTRYAQAPNKVDPAESLAEQLLKNNGSLPYEEEAASILRNFALERTTATKERFLDRGPTIQIVNPRDVPAGITVIESPAFKRQSHKLNSLLRSRKKSRVRK